MADFSETVMRRLIRARMKASRRPAISRRIRRHADGYRGLVESAGERAGRSVRVPPMLGVDADMRGWSLLQILEHNLIVNRSVTGIMASLARGRDPSGFILGDIKHDVMPAAAPGPEVVTRFAESVDHHLSEVGTLPRLRGTDTVKHPIFGPLDAHGWHAMFELHLALHLRQARHVHAAVRAM